MLVALVFSLLVSAEPASTPGADPVQAAAPARSAAPSAVGKDDPDRIICKKESVAGSRFTTKTCRTLAEWQLQARNARTFTRDVQGVPNLPATCTGQC